MKPTAVLAAVGFVVSSLPVQYRYERNEEVDYVRTNPYTAAAPDLRPAALPGRKEVIFLLLIMSEC